MLMDRDYRNILRSELIRRCNRNPKYSLRAFAKHLGLDAAQLSEVINGRKGLSRHAAHAIAKALNLTTSETSLFCNLVDSRHARSRKMRTLAQEEVDKGFASQSVNQLTLDAFRAISEWYHLAILQLMRLPSYQENPVWIARALGVTLMQVKDSLRRLERLGMIEKQKSRFVPVEDYVISPDGIPSDAIKAFHEQILGKAIEALFIQRVEERDFFTTLLPVSQKNLSQVRERIRQFNQAIIREFSTHDSVDRVYSLSTQFFNLTPNLETKEQ